MRLVGTSHRFCDADCAGLVEKRGAMNLRRLLPTLAVLLLAPQALAAAAAGEGRIEADAKVLLASTARSLGADPRSTRITNVTVSGDTASADWQVWRASGRLSFVQYAGRWIADQTPAANPALDVSIDPAGGIFTPDPAQTAGYRVRLRYAPGTASMARFSFAYGRLPTPAEFLPYPTTPNFTADAVFFFDLTVSGKHPVTFSPGSQLEVWFPFVLDDRLRYELTIEGAQQHVGPLYASPFDNMLRFALPAFTAIPDRQLVGEIDGD